MSVLMFDCGNYVLTQDVSMLISDNMLTSETKENPGRKFYLLEKKCFFLNKTHKGFCEI